MNSQEIRKAFLDFFRSKHHHIVSSAPIVVKNDPTLMFTNAGMNQFKDIFLGNTSSKYKRIANTQKCLRVSGKHNDLEEVGVDTYHHTMFEMLGNWAFGDYFKKEAIEWAWELLTAIYKLPEERLYVTVFEGNEEDKIPFDAEAFEYWKQWIAEERILKGSKKDNFWEMGDTGPCGPCSEIHIDLRTEEERKQKDGKDLINIGHPQVIEIWNLVFIEFNRRSGSSLEKLPAKHVDTGMGFERLCMAIQRKTSNYDTDVFQPTIQFIAKSCGRLYGKDKETDIAMRVLADHIRAIAFTIADGQLPSNIGAGYVIRRILRRAVRYAYSFLGLRKPFLHKLIPLIAEQFEDVFPELKAQQEFIYKVIQEEEFSFLKTLSTGIHKFENYIRLELTGQQISGSFAFELYDTYGFPIDLTQLLAREKKLAVDMKGFNVYMETQKKRSRAATSMNTGDWVIVSKQSPLTNGKEEEIKYDFLELETIIHKYRKVKEKNKELYQIVLFQTPFYPESGGQTGDTGIILDSEGNTTPVLGTRKENELIIHYTADIPKSLSKRVIAKVDEEKRKLTTINHTATHLLHAALKQILGTHVEQKGSLVNDEYLRFDFSHFSKITDKELAKVETLVNEKVRENIPRGEERNVSLVKAQKMGATALFGEKYGDYVRVITFDEDFSRELCGGTHVKNTKHIRMFKIISEGAVAAGVRRIEAITAAKAELYINEQLNTVKELKELLKSKNVKKSVLSLLEENAALHKELENVTKGKVKHIKAILKTKVQPVNGINFIAEKIELDSPDAIKDLAFQLKSEVENLFLVVGTEVKGNPSLTIMISENLVNERSMDAGKIVRELAKEIQGGGGGQPFYATAGGKNMQGLEKVIAKAKSYLE